MTTTEIDLPTTVDRVRPGVATAGSGATRRSLRAAAAQAPDRHDTDFDQPPGLDEARRARRSPGARPLSAALALLRGTPAKAVVRWRVTPRAAWTAVLCLAVVCGAVALRASAAPPGAVVEVPPTLVGSSADPSDGGASTPGETDARAAEGDDGPASVVLVHVVGQVGAPGVVELADGLRVADAIAAAGGAGAEADLSALNLAEIVGDGQQVRVPRVGEEPASVPDTSVALSSGSGAAGLVDVNRADASALETLPGIGPVLAERIVEWRNDRGAFATVDDLRQVSGIGPALLEKLRPRVTV